MRRRLSHYWKLTTIFGAALLAVAIPAEVAAHYLEMSPATSRTLIWLAAASKWVAVTLLLLGFGGGLVARRERSS